MDGVSSAASILQLVQLATQVTGALNQYVVSVRDAESSRRQLADHIALMITAATAVEKILRKPPLSSRSPEQQALLNLWSKVDGPPMQCRKVLVDLLSWIETSSNRRMYWIERLKWPMKESKVNAAIRAFEEHMPYFRDVLSIDTL